MRVGALISLFCAVALPIGALAACDPAHNITIGGPLSLEEDDNYYSISRWAAGNPGFLRLRLQSCSLLVSFVRCSNIYNVLLWWQEWCVGPWNNCGRPASCHKAWQ